MTALKRNPDRPIFRLLIFDHGIVNFLLLFFLALLPHVNAQIGAPPPDSYSLLGPKFNPTMAIVMVILVSVFFLMGFFSVYVRRCSERRFPRNNTDSYGVLVGGANRRSRRGACGLDESVINTFPTFLYSEVKGLKIGKGSLECAVCLNEFEDEETLRLIPKCSHVFHTDCIDAWLTSHNTCPVCRANLVPEPGETPSCFVQIFIPDNNMGDGEPEQRSNNNSEEISQVEQRRERESADVNLINQNRPPRSRSTGWRLTGLFPRSHSTGHSLVQPNENCERFTLRLTEEVRNQLMNSSLNRSKSCVAFPRVRSSRRGFRSVSGGFGRKRSYHFSELFDRPSRSGHLGLSLTPPFISRMGSVRSPKMVCEGVEVACTPLKRFKSLRSTVDHLSTEDDRNGERVFDRLRSDNQV